MNGAEVLLKVEDLTKHFAGRNGVVKAVDGVSFEVRRGTIVGLVGESGSGKTTAGRCALRLVEPSAGRIIFDGVDLTSLSARRMRDYRRRMQIVFQDPYSSLNPRLKVDAIIGEAIDTHRLARGAARRERIAELLIRVGLEPGAGRRYPHEFSGGQRQRIGIARALAVEPDFIVADEPVSALDVSVQAQVLNLIQDLQQAYGLTMLLHRARSLRRRISVRRGRRDVSRPGHGAGTEPRDLCDAAPSLYARSAFRLAGPGPEGAQEARRPPRGYSEPDQPALRMRLSHPLPCRDPGLRRGRAAARKRRAGTPRRLHQASRNLESVFARKRLLMDLQDIRPRLNLRPIVNVSGTMTSLGASIAPPEVVAAVAGILPQFVEIDDVQKHASHAIARLCATEAGFVTASCSAGITLAVAGAMTGSDLAAIERLPDTKGLRNEVLIQTGHMVSYGAPVEQAIRLAGARVVPVGQTTSARKYQLAGAINERTAAAVYVVSHHTVQVGLMPLDEFVEVCHAAGVPVIVDAASEYDLRGFLAAGADVAIYSSHKFLGGPTGGIVAGRTDLVRAAYLQNCGIGRGMKVGKEGMVGTIAALETWEKRDHKGIRERETGYLKLWQNALADRPGIRACIEPDPTHNPLDRLKVAVEPQAAHITAWDLVDALARGAPPIIVRDHEVEHGYFYMDPCNLHPGEATVVVRRLAEELDLARQSNEIIATSLERRRNRRAEALLRWPA